MKRIFKPILFLFCSFLMYAHVGNALTYTKSIPVLIIQTDNNDVVNRKDTTWTATWYLETFGWKGYESVGTKEEPLACEIKCRGNWTFTNFDKKPYKIKFSEKMALLGMPKDKHWVLLAHADDRTRFLRNSVGFEVSRMLGMKYTPRERPVELVLNGEYLGLYMLTEHIRVGKNRVDIDEQNNDEEDINAVNRGGWLLEIDNYEKSNQMVLDVTDTDLKGLRVTFHSPESLSSTQYGCLKDRLDLIKSLLYCTDKSSREWEEYIDIDELTRYAINTEVTAHEEAYFGSTFFYKQNGGGRFLFGPVWDFGNSILSCWKKSFTWEPDKNLFGVNIMTEISKFPHFQKRIREMWPGFYKNSYKLYNFIDSISADIAIAAENDAKRWPQYVYDTYGTSIAEKCEGVKSTLRNHIEWLNEQWGTQTIIGDANNDGEVTITDAVAIVNSILGNHSETFNIEQADITGDGKVTIADAVGVVNIILKSNNIEGTTVSEKLTK